MAQTQPAPKKGDRCPIDGGELVERRAPTDDERAAAANQDTPMILPATVDNATKKQREELGALYECLSCHYKTRIKDDGSQGADDRSRQTRDRTTDDRPNGAGAGTQGNQGSAGETRGFTTLSDEQKGVRRAELERQMRELDQPANPGA